MKLNNSSVSWTVRGGRVLGPAPFFIVGIVNTTPDSFYDGGKFIEPNHAIRHGLSLLDEGATILDVGGESSRPFSDPISAEQEIERILPVIETFVEKQGIVSVDTYKADVAKTALEAGAHIVNDISACRFDSGLLEVISEAKPGYVLMHSQGKPKEMQVKPSYENVVDEISRFFEQNMHQITRAGLPEDRIVLDPGIGFGKSLDHNLEILASLEAFLKFNRPLYIGLSNKSFLSNLLDIAPGERKTPTQAATMLAAMNGARIHRVHEVKETVQTLTLVQAVTARQEVQGKE